MRQYEAARLPGAAVAAGVGAGLDEQGVVVFGVGGSAAQFDVLHAVGGEGAEFVGLADAVLIEVAPNAHAAEGGVFVVEYAIARSGQYAIDETAFVEVGQGGKAVAGFLAVGQYRFIAEEFRAGVDAAIAVAIPHQQAIVRTGPGGAGFDEVAIGVEEDVFSERADFKAVAIEVEHQWVDVFDGFD